MDITTKTINIRGCENPTSIIIATFSNMSAWDAIKSVRNSLLEQCDWTQVLDAALTEDEINAWREYRQALRDIPQTFINAEDVIWPTPPTN